MKEFRRKDTWEITVCVIQYGRLCTAGQVVCTSMAYITQPSKVYPSSTKQATKEPKSRNCTTVHKRCSRLKRKREDEVTYMRHK